MSGATITDGITSRQHSREKTKSHACVAINGSDGHRTNSIRYSTVTLFARFRG